MFTDFLIFIEFGNLGKFGRTIWQVCQLNLSFEKTQMLSGQLSLGLN